MASPISPINDVEKEKIHECALDEMRAKYDHVNTDYNNLGTKIFTLIATELVISTFLFTQKLHGADKPLFVLKDLATIIFFGVGIASVIFSLGILFWSVTSNKWAMPAEIKELSLLRYRTYIDFLVDTKDDYIEAFNFCAGRYDKRRKAFDYSVILFIVGAIILMVIKIGVKP